MFDIRFFTVSFSIRLAASAARGGARMKLQAAGSVNHVQDVI
jgi:hypothetical protein